MSNRVCHFKLVLLGDTAVGKSCMVHRFVRDEHDTFQEPTIGASFMQQNVFIPEKEVTVRFEIWDTAGQERYRSLAPMYYRGATAAVVVYDITKKESFAGAKSWVKELKRRGEDNVVIALAGNKCDMEAKRKVETEDALTFADQSGLIFMETSALNNTNIKELFLALARKLPLEPVQSDAAGSGGIKLVTPNKASGNKGGCC